MALFEVLFELKITHNYYRDNRSSDFQIIPSKATKQQFSNHGMLFRNNPSGCSVLAEVIPAGGGLEMLRPPGKPVRYQFLIKQQRPHFLNYTDLPFHEVGKTLYHFNNLNENIEGATRYLHSPSGEVTATDQIPLREGIFRYSTSGTAFEKTARLVFPDINIEAEQQARNVDGKFNFQFDLSNYPAGRAELWIDGSKEELFYASGQQEMEGIFGVLEIFHSNGVPSTYQFLDSSDMVTTQHYQLAFKRRNTYWKYIVINKTGIDLDDPGIQNGSYTFTQDTTGSYPGNWTVFISDQKMPLSEEGVDSLSLRKDFTTSNRKVLDNLPNPGRNTLKRDETDISKLYSEIFLYI